MSKAVTQESIELALKQRFSGVQLSLDAVTYDVPVFLEDPATEETTERTYPSVSIQFLTLIEAQELMQSDTDDYEEVGYDDTPAVHERLMRQAPYPYRLLYSIDTWCEDRALLDRQLVRRALLTKVTPRSFMSVLNIDGEAVDVDLFWDGRLANNDMKDDDHLVYHKTVSIAVVAYLTLAEVDEITRTAVSMEHEIEFRRFEVRNGSIEDEEVVVTLNSTENGVEPI